MAAAEILQRTPTDTELIERVLEGDQGAFEMLYDRYFPRILAFVNKRVSNRADAEEIVQEVFINIFSSLGTFRAEAPFAAWALGVARRTVWNRFKKKRHPTVPFDAGEDPDDFDALSTSTPRAPTPLEDYECRERIGQLNTIAQHALTSEQRELVERHHLLHQSIETIAKGMNKSENAVKSNLYRARKLLLA